MVIGGLRIAGLFGDTSGNASALLISEGWALFNLFLFIVAIRAVLQHMTRRNTYRFPVHVPVTVLIENRNINGITANVHEQGLALLLNEPLLESASVRVMMHLPHKQVEGTLMVRASKRSKDVNNTKMWHSSGPFTPDTSFAADTLDEFLISIMARQMQPQIEPALST